MTRVRAVTATALAATSLIWMASSADAGAPSYSTARTIRTTTFVNSPLTPSDLEGLVYVPRDNSLWLADDNSQHSIWEVDKDTGFLKGRITQEQLAAAPRFGGGEPAGALAASDLEALAYDEPNDVMYLFAGKCCTTDIRPTVFRLVRSAGVFVVESHQPLTEPMNDFNGAGVVNGDLWVAMGRSLYTYRYTTNSFTTLSTVNGIVGSIDGISDGPTPWIVSADNRLYRVDTATKQLLDGYDFDLTTLGILDARAVAMAGGQLIVVDGYDGRSPRDPLRYAVHVLNVAEGLAAEPSAAFTTSTSSGPAPLTVNFTDLTTGGATSWSWNFDDGSALDTTRSPSHTFTVPGTYRVSLTATRGANSSSATATVTVTGGSASSGIPVLRPLTPQRLLDTRALGSTSDQQFQGQGRLVPGDQLELQIVGRGGVPLGASAVALNVTAVDATGDGYLTVWPCDTTLPPNASTLNFSAGQTVPNLVVLPLDRSGRACLQVTGAAADILADSSGYFPARSDYAALSPRRLLDTRPGAQTFDGLQAGFGLQPAGSPLTVQVTGRGLVPAGAKAVVLNVTVTGSAGSGYATAWPCDQALPNASNINFQAGQTLANAVIVPLSASGTICLQSTLATTNFLADVAGYFPGSSAFVALTPMRLLDSRSGGQTIDGRGRDIPGAKRGSIVELQITDRSGISKSATAAVLNVTATGTTSPGFVTVWPCERRDETAPNVSSVNFAAADIANAVIAPLSSTGGVCLQARDAGAELVVDISGVFLG